MNQFGESIDPLIESSRQSAPAGTHVARFGAPFGHDCTYTKLFNLIGGSDKNASALRSKVLLDVKALGGIKVEWQSKTMPVADVGEYGHKEYSRALRWILKITPAVEESTEGIKRRKVQ